MGEGCLGLKLVEELGPWESCPRLPKREKNGGRGWVLGGGKEEEGDEEVGCGWRRMDDRKWYTSVRGGNKGLGLVLIKIN